MKFAETQFLWALLVGFPAMIGFFYWSWRIKKTLIRQFVSARLLDTLTIGVLPRRQIFRMSLLVAALTFILLALARPQWGFTWEEAKQRGLDIIVAIDTSRSMLAQDVVPDRLERAKLAAFDLMKQAQDDRLGLVVFAGNAFLQTPLTLDDQAFRQGLDAVNVGIIPQGGTALSTAIQTATDSFEKNNDNHKVLILFTDGEDHDADQETLAAAKAAAEAGVHIFTVGVGTRAGELLRVRDDQGNYSYVKNEEGNVVKSQLNETLLQQIATDAGGFYLPLVGADPMKTLYARGLAPLPKTETSTRQTRVPTERYHWFLAIAMLCLIAEYLIPERPRRSRRADAMPATLQKAAALVLFLLICAQAHASPSAAYRDYQDGQFKSAADEYGRLAEKKTNDYRLLYDAGTAAYRAKELEQAEKQFNATLGTSSVVPDVATQEHTYYNLGNTEYKIGEPLSDPDKKKDRWQQAVDSYTHALTLNTNDVDARNNLVYVRRKLEELKRQQQQQQKQNQKNQNQKDQQNQQNQQSQQNQKNQQQKNQRQQKQQQGNQNQQNGQDQQKQEEQKQQEQAQREKQKQEQQKGSNSEKEKEQQQAGQEQTTPGQMSASEARRILAEQQDDEKALIFAPDNKPVKTQPGKFKDW